MYKNKNQDGSLNVCGNKIKPLKKDLNPVVSQRMLADQLQLIGINLDKMQFKRLKVVKDL